MINAVYLLASFFSPAIWSGTTNTLMGDGCSKAAGEQGQSEIKRNNIEIVKRETVSTRMMMTMRARRVFCRHPLTRTMGGAGSRLVVKRKDKGGRWMVNLQTQTSLECTTEAEGKLCRTRKAI